MEDVVLAQKDTCGEINTPVLGTRIPNHRCAFEA